MEEKRDFTNVQVVWEPREDSGALTKSFMKKVQEKYSVKICDYWDLYKWSIENLEKFWEELWHLSGIIYSKTYTQVIDPSVPMGDFHEWFAGSQMNYAENLLRYRDNNVALIIAGEKRTTIEKVTYAEVYEEAKLYAAALRKQGVKKNDIISCFMSNRKEAVIAMIATTSIGAVWVGVLPLMGPQAVLNRLSQVKPKILFTVDRFLHNKEEINMIPKLKEIAKGLASLEKVIIVPSKPASKLKDICEIRNSCFLDDFLENGKNCDGSVPEIEFEQVPFTHPTFISNTSGTTGLPKVLLHSSSILLTTYKIFCLQNNNNDRNSTWLSMSPVGWMTWNVFATMLSLGMRVVLFEGLPFFLSQTFFWDMVDDIGITHLLLTTNVLDEMEKRGIIPRVKNHLRSVKCIISGGSVVKPKNYDFVYGKIKRDVMFTSVYGMTECSGVPLFHDQTLKLHKCEVPAPTLGFDYQSVDDSGKPVIGEVGEIALVKPYPSFILGILGDTDDRSLFKKSYCDKFPGKLALGDLIITNPVTKGIIILGRSDETLKPGGCRFGSSEIYNIVENFPEILDSICVSQYSKEKLERAVLFLKMKSGCAFDRNLIERLKEAITKELSARHVPEVILETTDIPRNINGKKLEVTVKKIINKMPYNPEVVVNPECLKNFIDLPELSGY